MTKPTTKRYEKALFTGLRMLHVLCNRVKYYAAIVLLLLTVMFYGVACKKLDVNSPETPPPPFPDTTKVGANTFGAMVNDTAWLPDPHYNLRGSYYRGMIMISADKIGLIVRPLEAISISSFTNTVFSEGIYQLGGTSKCIVDGTLIPGCISAFYLKSGKNPEDGHIYYSNDSIPGTLRITRLDSVNRILSGTFEFTGISEDGKMAEVKKGRFDVKY